MKNKYENSCMLGKGTLIKGVVKNSIAGNIGIKKGYKLISINDNKIIDILDYKFNITEEFLKLELINLNNETLIYEIEKEEYEDLGLIFETELIDKPKNCRNKCIFCFMDQLPPNVRKTLVFKDDDYRLSFFTGNYITLTNMNESDIKRIIKYRLAPINISLHTTDEEIRCKMLNNKNAGKVLKYLDMLKEANIYMNLQIVLCKNINDKDVLYKTLNDITKYVEVIKSVSIVPVGISKYRKNLFKLEPFNKQDCTNVIENIKKFQKLFKKKYKTNLVYLSDEFYITAEKDIPKYNEYEDFAQLENGVGMISVFSNEFKKELNKLKRKIQINTKKQKEKYKENKKNTTKKIIVLTGKITFKFIKEQINKLKEILDNIDIEVVFVENNYFGKNITVTGLLTGKDILNTLNKINEEYNLDKVDIIIPDVCLKDDEDIFLDDITVQEIKEKYNKIQICETSAKGLIDSIYSVYKKNI